MENGKWKDGMRTFMMAALAAMCAASAMAQTVCFSLDGGTVSGGPRPLPVQGYDAAAGEVVVGLPARPVADWLRCGYWPFIQGERPAQVSNESYRVSGYALDKAALVARPVWKAVVPKARKVDYSKRKLYRAIQSLGVWPQVKSWMEAQGCWEDWEYATTLEADDPLVLAAIPALQQMLGLTDAEMREILKSCIAK